MSETKSIKTFRKAPYSVFTAAADLLGVAPAELARTLGYNGNPHINWQREDEIPYVASLAIEHLLSSRGVPKPKTTPYIVFASPAKHDALLSVLSAMSIHFVVLDINN